MATPEIKTPELPATTEQLICKYFGSECDYAIKVARAESGLRADATNSKNRNGSVDRGIFQVNSCHAGKVNGNLNTLYDPETNIRVAKQIRDESGWGAWSVVSKGIVR